MSNDKLIKMRDLAITGRQNGKGSRVIARDRRKLREISLEAFVSLWTCLETVVIRM